jgi:outer membrane lipoprotein-sorting protein
MYRRVGFFAIPGAVCLLAVVIAQAGGQQAGVTGAPAEILQKTLAVYQNAKSYQGDWVYLLKQGDQVTKMAVELKASGPTKLLFHLRAAAEKTDNEAGTKAEPSTKLPVVPEVRVLLDGKTAWFENATEKVYYKVDLPKNPVTSPLMFFPQAATVGAAERGEDEKEGKRTIAVIFAKTKTGGLSRMEIDTQTFRIVRIASDETTGLTRTISTLTIEKETFDGEIPDTSFSYKPGKGFKEMKAPPEAGLVFGAGSAEKQDKDK